MQETELSTKPNDIIASILKSGFSAVPWAGGVLSEIVSYAIPYQRQDRIVDFVKELNHVVENLSEKINNLEVIIDKIKNDKCQNHLLEIAFQSAVETDSSFLHHCYAYYIFNNLNNKTLDDIQREKLLKVISELNEYEITHLINFTIPNFVGNPSNFFMEHQNILEKQISTINGPKESVEFNAFYDQYKSTLEQKGLIYNELQVDKQTLDLTKKHYKITQFGRLVVEAIYDEDFFGNGGKN